MGLPTLENGPWTFNVNNVVSEATIDANCKHIWMEMKDVLASFSQWSVVASADGVSVKNIGDASPDLWTDWTTDIIKGDSWVLLENSVTGEQFLMDVARSDNIYMGILEWSPTGSYNTDGTATVRPTATEHVDIVPNGNFVMDSGIDGGVVHAMVSNDGKCTRLIVHQVDGTSDGCFFLAFEELANPNSDWTSTHKRCVLTDASVITSTTNTSKSPAASYLEDQLWDCYLKDASTEHGHQLAYATVSSWGSWSAALANGIMRSSTNNAWGGYWVSPIGIVIGSTVFGGSLGRIQDMYAAQESHNTLDTYDGAGSKEWVKFGGLMLPWNGTTPTPASAP